MSLESLYNNGIYSLKNNDFDNSIKCFLEAINLSKNDYIYYLLGLSYFLKKDINHSIIYFEKAIEINPNNDEYIFNLAHSYLSKGNTNLAIKLLNKCIVINPSNILYYKDLAIIFQELKQYDKSIELYNLVIEKNKDPESYNNLGLIYLDRLIFNRAKKYFEISISIDQKNKDYYINLILCLIKEYELFFYLKKIENYSDYISSSKYFRKLLDYALYLLDKSISLNIQDSILYNYYGIIYMKLEKYEDSIIYFNKAISLKDNDASYYSNLASAYEELNDFENSKLNYIKALELEPNNKTILKNYAFLLLKFSNCELGIQEYLNSVLDKNNSLDLKLNKSFYISREQGLGDEIQFYRFLKLIKNDDNHITYQCSQYLECIFKSNSYSDRLFTVNNNANIYDFNLSIITTSFLIASEKNGFNNSNLEMPYIYSEKYYKDLWSKNLSFSKNKKVAFIWKSKFPHSSHYKRAISFKFFYELSKRFPNIDFFSIQKGLFENEFKNEENRKNIFDLSKQINDFSDTVGILENVDLLVSVDTSVVHLAGALGKKVITLLPFSSNWRWGIEAESTFWYPSMKLIRQDKISDWDSVFYKLCQEIENFFYE